MLYMISYDLNKPGQNYSDLYKAIKKCGVWWHHLDSTWLVDSKFTVDEITNHLLKFMDKNDFLLVFHLAKSHQGQLPKRAWDWINKHLK